MMGGPPRYGGITEAGRRMWAKANTGGRAGTSISWRWRTPSPSGPPATAAVPAASSPGTTRSWRPAMSGLPRAPPLRRGGAPAQADAPRGRHRDHALRPDRPRGAERHLPGGQARHRHRGSHPLLPHDALPHLRHADHQLRHRPGGLRTQVPRRRRERGHVPRRASPWSTSTTTWSGTRTSSASALRLAGQTTLDPPRFHRYVGIVSIRILYIAEIVGKTGVFTVKKLLPGLKRDLEPDLVVACADGATGGAGVGTGPRGLSSQAGRGRSHDGRARLLQKGHRGALSQGVLAVEAG